MSTPHVPLDCPDSCSLAVTVSKGRVVEIDGSTLNTPTAGYICAKVRKFGDRVYGDARLQYPAVRTGPKGQGRFRRIDWDEAIELIATRMLEVREHWGGEAILPFSYGGSNGLLTQDTLDAVLFRRFGTSRLARTVCAAPTGVAAQALYGKMPSVTYEDYPDARLIVLWGVNPSTSGIHLVPYVREAQKSGARLVVIDPRSTPLARQADLHLAPRPGTDVAIALAIHRYLFEEGFADAQFLAEHTKGAEQLRARAAAWTFERAARHLRRARSGAATAGRGLRAHVAGADPLRLGTRAQSQWRQCGDVDSRPAGGRRKIRRAGRRLLDEQLRRLEHHAPVARPRTDNAHRQHEQARARAAGIRRSADQGALRLQLQSGRDDARSAACAPGHGSRRSLHGCLRSGDDRHRRVRRRHSAGDDVPGGVRLCARLRPAEPAARAAGHRCGRRIAIEPGGVRRAGAPPRAARGGGARQRARHAVAALQDAARNRGNANRRNRPRRAAVRFPPDSVRGRDAEDVRPEGRSVPGSARRGSAAGSVYLPARSRDRSLSAGADFAGERQDDQLDAGRAAAAGGLAAHAPGRCRASRPERRRSDQGVQRAGRGAVRGENRGDDPGRHGVAAEGIVAQEHMEPDDGQCARPRLADRPRRRRVLQRRPGGSCTSAKLPCLTATTRTPQRNSS